MKNIKNYVGIGMIKMTWIKDKFECAIKNTMNGINGKATRQEAMNLTVIALLIAGM